MTRTPGWPPAKRKRWREVGRRASNGNTVLVPFLEPIVAGIDAAAGLIRIDPPAGLLE